VHVPKRKEYFCIEPVSHPTDGFNLMQGKKENIECEFLAPNEHISGLIELDLEQ
jgi:galactose mutarotase-like enzyme